MKMNVSIVPVVEGENPSGKNINSVIMKQVKLACDALHAKTDFFQYDELDLDKTKSDAFYNAEVAVIDLSIEEHRNNLFYHLGVRESFGQKQNILLLQHGLKDTIKMVSNIAIEESSSVGHGKIVKFPGLDYPTLLYTEEEAINDNFITEIKKLLQAAEIQCKAHVKDKILSDLVRARENLYDEDTRQVFYSIKERLNDVSIISEAIVLNLLYGFREIEDFDSIVDVAENSIRLDSIPKNCDELPRIMYMYAFALVRCNRRGNREKAIKIILSAIEISKDIDVSNFYCLLGRIYKDKFIESASNDKNSLQESIKWYGKGFESDPNEYAGINLATMLIVSGETFSKSEQLTQIGMTINNLLGRKGNLSSVRDYWTLATFFEVNILTENYSKAVQTAELMFRLKPRQWYMRSTMRNLKLILDYRKKNESEDLKNKETLFQFWIEYFLDACKSEVSQIQDVKVPVLLSESRREYTPCYLFLSSHRKTVQISNSSLHSRSDTRKQLTQQNWIFSKDRIKSLNLLQRDNRGVFLRLRKNSDDFHMFFPNSEYRELFHSTVFDSNF